MRAHQTLGFDVNRPHPARIYEYWLGGEGQLQGRPKRRGRVGRQAAQPAGHRASEPAGARAAQAVAGKHGLAVALRSKAEVAAMLAGLDVLDPGVTLVHRWRPTSNDPELADADVHLWGAAAVKP